MADSSHFQVWWHCGQWALQDSIMDALEAIQRGARDFLLKLQAALLGKQRFPLSCMCIWSDFGGANGGCSKAPQATLWCQPE